MCIGIYVPEGKYVNKKTLKVCYENNPDGAGLMYSDGKNLIIDKGFFSFKSFWKEYRSIMQGDKKKSGIVLHFRVATHGNISKRNCHPFQVNENLGFVHNGMIDIKMEKGSTMSDTAVFNELILKKLPGNWMNNDSIIELISGYIGQSKLIFMDSTGSVLIINKSLGEWKDGIWYSNTTYKGVVVRRQLWKKFDYGSGYYSNDLHECQYCGTPLLIPEEKETGMCFYCLHPNVDPKEANEIVCDRISGKREKFTYQYCDGCGHFLNREKYTVMDGNVYCDKCQREYLQEALEED